jgi:dTDP-glucose 4,6-dehydratase
MSRELGPTLVTGGAGFIGAHVVRRLLAASDAPVVVLDALTYAGDRRRLQGCDAARLTFVHGDVTTPGLVAELLRAHDVRTALHLAAESHVDRSIAGPAPFLTTNVLGTAAVLEAARAVWGDREDVRVHHVSTDEVYGDLPAEAPASQPGDPYRPSSPYAASKAAADHLVHAWARTYGLRASVSHGSNTYGPGQVPEKLVPVALAAALSGRSVPVYGDGLQVRDWIYVADHADGILAAAAAAPGVWHLGGECPRTNLDLLADLCAALDAAAPAGAPHVRHLQRVADRPGHDRRYALDTASTRAVLPWCPRVALAEGLARTVAAWRAGRWLDAD